MAELQEQKALLRKQYRGMRKKLTDKSISENSAAVCQKLLALPEYAAANTIFCYVSMAGEPKTDAIINDILHSGKRLFVPRCTAQSGVMEAVEITDLCQLVVGTYGIREPRCELCAADMGAIDFAVIPAIACGLDGTRLGQGGGYYDRFLQSYHAPHVALCFEAFLCATLPRGPFDCKLDCVITEERIIRPEDNAFEKR